MADSKNGVSLREKVLTQLKELETAVLELLEDAEAGRQVRQLFSSTTSSRSKAPPAKATSAPRARPQKARAKKESPPSPPPPAAQDKTRAESSELAEKVVAVLTGAKKGLKVRELREQLPEVAAGSLTYQLEKLVKAKKLLKRGKTSKTTYRLAPA